MKRRTLLLIAAMSTLLFPSIAQANPIVTGWQSDWYVKHQNPMLENKKPQWVKNYHWDKKNHITPKQQEIMHEGYKMYLQMSKLEKAKAKQKAKPVSTKVYSENDKANAPLNTILVDPIVPVQESTLRPVDSLQNSNALIMYRPTKKTNNVSKKVSKGAI